MDLPYFLLSLALTRETLFGYPLDFCKLNSGKGGL